MIGIILFGAISFTRLGVSYLPDIDYPTLNINANWAGAAPEVMESEIVDPIEERVVAVEGVREMRSNITQGSANITLEFDPSRNVDAALQEVQANLQQVHMPLTVLPPTIRKFNPEDDPIIRVAVYGDRPLRDLADYVDKHLDTALQIVRGVGNVSVSGFGARNLRVWIDNDKLKKYQLTVTDIATAVEAQHEETSGGYIENALKMYNIRTVGEGITPAQIGDILILRRGGQAIYDSHIHVRDVAKVEDGLSDVRSIVRLDGKPAVTININKQRGSNEIEVSNDVKARLDDLKKDLPPDLHIAMVVDYTRFTKKAVEQTEHELIVAGLLTSFICFLFLGTWTSSINVLISIPTSVIGAFIALNALHFTLNLFTLLALALAIGIIVDDSIMVLENIVRHFEMGKNRRKAAQDGAREITFAAVAATVAVAAIFLPVAFMKGVIGYFFFQFGITITVAVFFSLLEAITLTPMRCSRMLTAANHRNWLVNFSDRAFRSLSRRYRFILDRALNWRWVVLLGSAFLFGGSLTAFSFLRQEFVPPQDQNFFHVNVETPLGSSIYFTDDKMKIVEGYIKKLPEVSHYLSTTNGYNGGFDVVLVDRAKRHRSQQELIQLCRTEIPTLPGLELEHFWLSDLSGRGLSARSPAPLGFNIRGSDYGKLTEIGDKIKAQLNATGLVTDLNTNYRSGMPEAEIIPDRDAAAERGVSVDAIGQTVSAGIGGALGGKYTSGGHRYDIRLQLETQDRMQPNDIRKLDIWSGYGQLLPLSEVTKITEHSTLQSVNRIDRQRTVSITANLAQGVSQSATLERTEKIVRSILPPGYEFHWEGSSQGYKETFGSLWFALILGLAVAYMVLAIQFDSFLHPVSVLLALPFSLSGALIALWVTNQSLNLFSMIGIILLMGIAKKNSILLVEFTNQVRTQDKRPIRDALLDACPIRLRPILMTSVATISSAIPSALGLGSGSETRVPMAIAVIGGVVISTFFTLFIVPCAYSLLAPLEKRSADDEDSDESSLGATTPAPIPL